MGLSDNRVYNPKSKTHHFRGTYNQGPFGLIPIEIFMVLCFFPFQEGFSLHKDTGDPNGATWIPGSARSLRGQGAGTLEAGATAVSLEIYGGLATR
jgi:hypothetical protein